MKIKFDIDCTPEEARSFLGLPDVQPLQEAVMAEMKERMLSALRAMEPDALMKQWLPTGLSGMEQMQKFFWQQFAGGKPGGSKEGK